MKSRNYFRTYACCSFVAQTSQVLWRTRPGECHKAFIPLIHAKCIVPPKRYIFPYLLLLLATIAILIGCERQPLIVLPTDPEEDTASKVKIGETSSKQLYTFGTILIGYDRKTWRQPEAKKTSAAAVHNFLGHKGYTPKVTNTIHTYRVEIIDIGESADPLPLRRELDAIPGVQQAELNTLTEVHDLLIAEFCRINSGCIPGPDPRREIKPLTPAMIGTTSDGILFEHGVLLVQYDQEVFHGPMRDKVSTAVRTFLSNKGYRSVTTLLPRIAMEIIDIDEIMDPTPLIEDIERIPGVAAVQLNILYDDVAGLLGHTPVNLD